MASSASNLGPTNEELLAAVRRAARRLPPRERPRAGAQVPIDAVTASGSGLDPHISAGERALAGARVARARGLPLADVLALVDEHTDGRSLGFLGEPGVNVLELNLALDARARLSGTL